MAKAGKDVRYRRVRDDIFAHRKTVGMTPLAYCVMIYALQQNIIGVLEASPRMVARRFAGVTAEDVEAAMDLLVLRGVAKRWPELETLWIINALDEQSDGGKADVAGAKATIVLPDPIRSAVVARYGKRVADPLTHGGYPCPIPMGDTHGGWGIQEQKQYQEQEQEGRDFFLSEPETPVEQCAKRVLLALNQARSEFVPNGRLSNITEIEARLREGRTEAECLLVIAGEVAACRQDKKKNLPWFDTITPFRAVNFERRLARAQANESIEQPSEAVDIAELARRQREERGE